MLLASIERSWTRRRFFEDSVPFVRNVSPVAASDPNVDAISIMLWSWCCKALRLVRLVRLVRSKLETNCDLLNESFLVYSTENCLWDFFQRLFGHITHFKVFKKKIAEDSLSEASLSEFNIVSRLQETRDHRLPQNSDLPQPVGQPFLPVPYL